jgi:hypothetical protein
MPELHLKTSNTHNFLSIGPKNTTFILPQRLLHSASLQKVSKNQKNYCTCRSLPKSAKTNFRVDYPLGIKVLLMSVGVVPISKI